MHKLGNMIGSTLTLGILLAIVGRLAPVASQQQSCVYDIVESMPDMLNFNQTIDFKPKPTHEALIELITEAKSIVKIASFYLTLSAEPKFVDHPSAAPGKAILAALDAAAARGVKLEVILDGSSSKIMSNPEDVKHLEELGVVKFVNMTRLLKSGILHTKFLISDDQSMYVGSSNFDWRSYSEIKEIGIRFSYCPEVTQDLDKIFRTYMLMSDATNVPGKFPDELKTTINIDKPLKIKLGNLDSKMFIASSPPAFNGVDEWTGRSDDIDALLRIIDKAWRKVDISVMNYSPRTQFTWPKKFWPRIDDALRRAASERRVNVRLMFSQWSHVKPEERMWYNSLNAIQSKALGGGGIHVKMFKVPAFDDFQKSIPYARVKHDKYLVTDNGLYIGTSNWTPDYFINTCGVSVIIEPQNYKTLNGTQTVISDMQSLFDRDFNSDYAQEL